MYQKHPLYNVHSAALLLRLLGASYNLHNFEILSIRRQEKKNEILTIQPMFMDAFDEVEEKYERKKCVLTQRNPNYKMFTKKIM